MASSADIRDTLAYIAVTIVTFVVLQPVYILMHEFTHSTLAWLLGYMPGTLSIVWQFFDNEGMGRRGTLSPTLSFF